MLCRTASASFSGCVVVAVRMPVSVLAAQPGLVGATGCTAPRAGRHRQGAVHARASAGAEPARASAGAEPARAQNGPGTDPVLLVQFDRPCARLRFWHIRCEHRVLLRGPRPQRRGGGAAEGQVLALGPARCVRATLEQDAPPRICSAARCEVKEAGSSAPSSRAAR